MIMVNSLPPGGLAAANHPCRPAARSPAAWHSDSRPHNSNCSDPHSVAAAIWRWNRDIVRAFSARPLHKIGSGRLELRLQPLDQLGDRWRVGDLADALSGAPDIAPCLGFGVAAAAEIHLPFVGGRQVGWIERRG